MKNLLVCALLSLLACQHKTVVQSFPQEFVGVGLELQIANDYPVVVRTLTNSPAQQAGVEPQDVITAIDDASTEHLQLGDAIMKLRGKPGTQVVLTIQRRGGLVRAVVVRSKMVKGEAGYVAE